jgi:hypothetical protein
MNLPWYIQAASGALSFLTFAFIIFFLAPALYVGFRLNRVRRALKKPEFQGPRDLVEAFPKKSNLHHAWQEFRKTLVEEGSLNPVTGVQELTALRATVPAEVFFTDEYLVDAPLNGEFFKHLPGIFTGIGIIGTFSGLLSGLRAFRISEDANVAHAGLERLLHSVSEAFLVSASAIALAMVITLIEKFVLVRLYAAAQRLRQAIDERFKAGVGEEYLSRLVGATEESVAQSKILKDALVGDLKTILTELSERQIAAFGTSHRELGNQITEAVASQLKQPLDRLAAATDAVRGDQGAAVQQLVADLLSKFASRFEEVAHSQVTGLQEVQQRMIQALEASVGQLRQMSSSIEGASQKASEQLMDRLSDTLHKLDQRQLVMTEEVRKFVHEIRSVVGESQTESHRELQSLLAALKHQTGSLVADLTEKSQAAVGAMGAQSDALAGKLAEFSGQMTMAVQKLEGVTLDAVDGMNTAARTLEAAAGDFAKAGQGVSGVLIRAEGLTRDLVQSAGSVGEAGRSLGELVGQYRQTRDAISQMLVTVQATVESARREAAITTDVLDRLDGAAQRLQNAQRAADEYLSQVTRVLGDAHQAFADSMTKTLDTGNRRFFDSVSMTVKLLREVIQELEQSLGGAVLKTGTRG